MPRKPLTPLDKTIRASVLRGMGIRGVDEDLDPAGSSPAEKLAARNPGLPDPNKESRMDEVSPGWKTSEFWLKLVVTLVVLPLVLYFKGEASPLPSMIDALKAAGPAASIVALVLQSVLPLGLAWLATKLAEKYAANRTALKLAQLQFAANDNGEKKAA